MIVPLPGGQEATLRERLTYGQGRAVRAAFLAMEGNMAALADLDLELVKAFVSAWNVMDLEGKAVSLTTPELAPDDVIQAISVEAFALWRKLDKALPKLMTEPSPTTSPGRRSK